MIRSAAILFVSALFLVQPGFAQDGSGDPKSAADKFAAGNYDEALEEYLDLLEKEPKSEKYNYRVAVCYLNTNINKAKAIPYLEIVTRQTKYEPDALYLLGRAYHFAYRLDDALKAYNKFKEGAKGTPENLAEVDHEIQNCYNAKELLKYPLNVTFENLGPNVNSSYSDYYPFVPADESSITFSTRRPEGGNLRNADGSYYAAVFNATVKDGAFTRAKNIGAPISNDKGNVEVIGLSSAGDRILVYYDNIDGSGDIYLSEIDKTKGYFKKPVKLDDNVNSAKGYEIAASISSDGNTIYFASDRAGGQGGTDIFMSKRLPTGKWGPPVNLGTEINTKMDEDFPSLSPDGKTLYFSSKGHTSMGGYDIFKAELNEETGKFGSVKNLGYPINTPEDNSNFCISENGRYGYIAAMREGGLGDYDIYRVTFNDVEPRYSVISGTLSAENKTPFSYSDVFITVTNMKNAELVGNYVPNANSGRYVIILPPGEYSMTVETPGFKEITEKLSIMDKSSFRTEIDKNIVLKQ
ncbi:MAG: tpn50 [Bacteroidetes bacterium]|nr:MAG: tpn50 [Bacteroidota bacterium]